MLNSSATQQANGERLLEMIEVAKEQLIFDIDVDVRWCEFYNGSLPGIWLLFFASFSIVFSPLIYAAKRRFQERAVQRRHLSDATEEVREQAGKSHGFSLKKCFALMVPKGIQRTQL